MKQFRVTIIAICLILGWLGYADLSLLLRNPEPLEISIVDLEATGAPREWLTVHGGYQDLLQAINMSGTLEIDSFLVPLKSTPDSSKLEIWFESRDPEIIDALKTYHFMLETDEQQQAFLRDNQQFFLAQRQLTGMTANNLVADSNQKKLTDLLTSMNIPITDNTIFISEGKQPVVWRGVFFFGIALIGLVKVLLTFRKTSQQ